MDMESVRPQLADMLSKIGNDLLDEYDSPVQVESFKALDERRCAIYAEKTGIKDFTADSGAVNGIALSVSCKAQDGSVMEHIVIASRTEEGGAFQGKVVTLECMITMGDYPLSMLAEYSFRDGANLQGTAGEDGWMLSSISIDALNHYRQRKFDDWKNNLLKIDCKAGLRKMLKIGLITRLYDPDAFPSPQSEKHLFETTNDRGKVERIPRPVSALRVWDASSEKYVAIDPVLEGVPRTAEECASVWNGLLQQLRTMHGEEELAELMQ